MLTVTHKSILRLRCTLIDAFGVALYGYIEVVQAFSTHIVEQEQCSSAVQIGGHYLIYTSSSNHFHIHFRRLSRVYGTASHKIKFNVMENSV